MSFITLTTTSAERKILVNWDNVDFVIDTTSPYGDKYAEVHCGKQTIDVKESLEEIEAKINGE